MARDMLLTVRDWAKFPSARIHYETKNTSFLKLANAYKNIHGIKNHAFLVAIIHPELAEVDPHDPNLDQQTIALIYRECMLNPFYMVRECIKLPADGADKPVAFKANRGNIALLWCFFMHMTYISIQPRQTGKSVGAFSLISMVLTVLTTNTTINLYTKDDKLRREAIKKIKQIISLLPQYLVPKSNKDPDNQEEIAFRAEEIKNTLLSHLPQKDKKQANSVCRGTTASIFLGDEVPFCPNSHISVPAAIAAGNKARENSREAGQLFGNIFTTTAGKLDDNEGAAMYARLSCSAPWNDAFLDAKDPDDLERLIDMNRRKLDSTKDTGPAVNGTFNHRQLGVPDDVHYKNIRQSGGDGDAINRDFFNIWSSGGQYNPISNDILGAISMSEKEPVYTEITTTGIMINWYISKQEVDDWPEHRKVIFGVDTSNAVGSDSCTGTMVDSITLAVIGTFNFNKGSLVEFIFDFLAKIMIKHKWLIMIPENKINGQSVIDGLYVALYKAGEDPFKRIFNGIVQSGDTEKFKDFFKEIKRSIHSRRTDIYDKTRKYFGFITAGVGEQSRSKLYGDVLETATRRCKDIVRDRTLSREIKAITVKNGRLDHPEGAHDDQLISWLLCHWLIMYGKNLSHYGIDTSSIRIEVKKQMTKEDYLEEFKRNRIIKEIDDVKQEMQVASSKAIFIMLKAKLDDLKAKLPNDAVVHGIDEFVAKLEEDLGRGNNRALSAMHSPSYRGFGGRTYIRPELL